MWNLLLLVALATSVSQFQINARSESGSDAPEIREAIARALVAGGMRVVLGGKDQDCDSCARVNIVEKRGGIYQVQVEQDTRRASSTVRLAIDTPLLDKARALAVQVRLLTGPTAKTDAPVVASRPSKPSLKNTIPERNATTAGVTATPQPSPVPDPPRLAPTAMLAPPPASLSPAPTPVKPVVSPEPVPANPVALAAPNKVAAPPTAKPIRAVPPVASPALTAKADPPGVDGETPRWPYIPLAIGVTAGVSAVVCGLLARDRYDALSNRNWSLEEARSWKNQGETLQVASFVLGGTAVVGSLVAWAGFSTKRKTYRPVALASADGAWVGLAGEWP